MQKSVHMTERSWHAPSASIMLDGIIGDLEIAAKFLEANQAAYTNENCLSLFAAREWKRVAITVSPPIPLRNFGDIQAWAENNYEGKIPGREHITIAEAIADFKPHSPISRTRVKQAPIMRMRFKKFMNAKISAVS